MIKKLIKKFKAAQAANQREMEEKAKVRNEVAKDLFDALMEDEVIKAEIVKPKHWVNNIVKK